MANTETTCAACARLTANTRDSSGSMASQMRCAAMLANVAKESSRMERRVAAGMEPVVTCKGRGSNRKKKGLVTKAPGCPRRACRLHRSVSIRALSRLKFMECYVFDSTLKPYSLDIRPILLIKQPNRPVAAPGAPRSGATALASSHWSLIMVSINVNPPSPPGVTTCENCPF